MSNETPRKAGRPAEWTETEVNAVLTLSTDRNISCKKACAMAHKSYPSFVSAAHRLNIALPKRGRRPVVKAEKTPEVAA
jgi:hypothetical protein